MLANGFEQAMQAAATTKTRRKSTSASKSTSTSTDNNHRGYASNNYTSAVPYSQQLGMKQNPKSTVDQ